ncbi:hypothetical protein FRZ67_03115 [Panacibacter ginsenosidivorans]|uniref:Uncharacterized protein n=1 Tax=Panacibacter ginsenosidivorans TaxID=1813871 RepID=A0A5B8V4M9_9BACT|nr:hypothetical protein [Panacibacter ginsenosidivorans]QEC66344.1 hypothetical protein FRZ67_03115 [Panacibacter ginsenosidivorans]
MQINIHWGEFIGPANRTEVKANAINKETGNSIALYKYDIDLKGYLPFSLFKNIQTNKWLSPEVIAPEVSKQVIFYVEKIVDEYENKYNL